jgi:hypothetical protein
MDTFETNLTSALISLELRKFRKEMSMSARSYFIELRVNFDNNLKKEKEEMLMLAAARMAKGLCATAMMISDRSKPSIAMHSSDFLEGDTEIDLNEIHLEGPCPTCGHEGE